MPKYKLNIHIKEGDLKVITKAHQKVVLVKHTAGDKDLSAVWVSFKPWQLLYELKYKLEYGNDYV